MVIMVLLRRYMSSFNGNFVKRDIDTGTSSVPVIGETAQELLQFIGDTLRTKLVVGVGGVYIIPAI
jgi:NCAIR mutase (PurE)-related protein